MANHLGQAIRLPDYMADATLSYYADLFRSVIDHLGTSGRRDSKSLVVQPYPGGGMRIQVTPGTALVRGTDRGAVDISGITLQGSYIVRVDATIGPITIAAAPSSGPSRVDAVWLVVSDKAENGTGTNDAYVMVQDNALTQPTSALRLANIVVATGASAITGGMISPGALSANPALVDPNYGYVDRFTTDDDTSNKIAAKRFKQIAVGTSAMMGTNIMGRTIAAAGFTLPNAVWTDIPLYNSDPANGIDYADVSFINDGQLYQNPAGPLDGWVPNAMGWYRVSACFGFGTGGGASDGQRGLRAITEHGRVLTNNVKDANEVTTVNPLEISQPFYWGLSNEASNPIKVQLYQGSGASMTIPNADGQHPQVAVLERLA